VLVFLTVLGLTVLLGIGCVLLALLANSTEQFHSLIAQFETLMGTGFGALAGLLGGKVIGTTLPPRT
jgi:hypothetical protein